MVTKDITEPGIYFGNPAKKKMKYLDLKKQYETIKPEIDRVVADVLDNTSFIGANTLSFLHLSSRELSKRHTFCLVPMEQMLSSSH